VKLPGRMRATVPVVPAADDIFRSAEFMTPESKIDLSVLTRYNTPTVANAIELFELRPRNEGFLMPGFHCLQPSMAPIAGFASTCTISSLMFESFGRKEVFDYWEHVQSVPGPRIAVVQDLDPYPSAGSFWGEVNASVHLGLGCIGTVTNSGIRDVDEMRAAGFQALYRHLCVSHSYIHVTDFGKPVVIEGVIIKPGDLLQVDQHGALIVPMETLPHLEEAILEIERRERPVIDYARSGHATRAGLVDAMTRHIRNAPKWTPGH
jgi:4-hydroxy-4-methyl-2-oxoglutarate aldolase